MKVSPPDSLTAPPGDRRAVLVICLLLVVAVFLVFGQTLRHEFFNFDDDVYVSDNPVIREGLTRQGLGQVFTHRMCDFYIPLTMVSLMLDAQVYGLHPGGYHLTNVLLHATTAVLLFLALRRLTRFCPHTDVGASRAGTWWPSAFVAFVFAIHPLRVESVAWVTERKDMLSGLFFMLTLLMYAHYVEPSPARGQKSKVFYGLALCFYALGLLSKPALVTLPFVLLLLDFWPLGRFSRFPVPGSDSEKFTTRSAVWLVVEKLPFFLLSAASCVTTILAQKNALPVGELPLSLRFANAAMSYVAYLKLMFYPAGLAVLYPYPEKGLAAEEVAAALVLLAGLTAGVLACWRTRPYLLIGWLWYLGMLVPMIGVVQAGIVARADRFTYLSQIGIYLAVAWTIRDMSATWRWGRWIPGAAAWVLIPVLMGCAFIQTSRWRNSELLWTHTLTCTTDNYIAHNNLGMELLDQGRLGEAGEQFRKSIGLKPDYAYAHNNLASVLVRQGQSAAAVEHYRKAIASRPNFLEAHNNLGLALAAAGQLTEALEPAQRAVEINPNSAEARYNLGHLLVGLGRPTEAMEQYRHALALKPDYAEAHNNLAGLLAARNKFDEAAGHFRQAVKFKPDVAEVHNNLAGVLVKQGQLDEAIRQYQKVIQITPKAAEAHYQLGVALGLRGRLDEAAIRYRQAINLEPGYADAHGNLANVLATQGKLDEAIVEYQRTLELVPHSAQAHFRYGQALQTRGDFRTAIAEYQKVLELEPNHPSVRLPLAWVLATCPQPTLRDGNRAVKLAEQAAAISPSDSPQILDTLAAAYAAAGRFDEAAATARRALELPATRNNQPLAEAIQKRLSLYVAHAPYYEKP